MPNPYYYQPPRQYYQAATAPPAPANSLPPPPPYYYGAPGPVAQNPYVPQQQQGMQPVSCRPCGQDQPFVATTTYQPTEEVTLSLKKGELRTTAAAVGHPGPEPPRVTHLNFHDNRLTRIEGLEHFPSLLRLTVSWNDLTSLHGMTHAPYLRWVDASGNHLTDFTGTGVLPSLEWLNVTQSDITSFNGLDFAPNLTWLCLHHNRFCDFREAHRLPALQFLDVSDNEVRNVFGLERATSLREINLSNNPMCEGDVRGNVQSVKALSALPHLFRLNIHDTFYDDEEGEVIAHFRAHAPQVEVVTTEQRSRELGHNYKFQGVDVPLGGQARGGNKKRDNADGCCTVQ